MAEEKIVERVIIIPSELVGALRASTTLLRVEAAYLRSKGEEARARGIDVQLAANDQMLAKYG